MAFKQILRELETELSALETYFYRQLEDCNPEIAEDIRYLIAAGGKRIRPAFCFLGAKFGNYDLDKILPLAAALEFIHMSSLTHDDVMDEAQLRRGEPTLSSIKGNKTAVHTGDYLVGLGLKISAFYDDAEMQKVLTHTIIEMCNGEMQQQRTLFQVDQSLRDYFYRIKRKTALLLATSVQLGAKAADAPREATILFHFGFFCGMAFQIKDDLLDITADEKILGKPVAGDIRQGVFTLPVIYALRNAPERMELQALLTVREKSPKQIDRILQIVKSCGAIEYAEGWIDHYTECSIKQLNKLPDLPVKRSLLRLAHVIGERDY